MSLYNLIHGENAFAPVLLAVLGLKPGDVPRYRDCWWTGTEIAIHTRTGGGNRPYYDSLESCQDNYPEYFEEGMEAPSGPWNEDLRSLSTFLRDEDDNFDSTYATFYFSVPKSLDWVIPRLQAQDKDPKQRWQEFMDRMRDPASAEDADVKRTMAALAPLFEQLKANPEEKP